MNDQPVISHDERTDAVACAGSRLAFMVCSFGVLTIAAVRAYAFGEECWDLLGLFIVSNCVLLVYQRVKRATIFSWRWGLLIGLLGAVFGLVFALLSKYA
jgi:hypothetical protein